MQTIPNRFLTLGLALLGLFAACAQIHAQTVTSLLTMTNTSWHYYQNTNQPPVQGSIPWYQTNYSDTAWPQGPGVFGFETERVIPGAEIRTPLNLTQPGASAQTITYYFRTHFTYSLNTPGVEMWFTNFYDDGFVVYLNGGELYRIGVPTSQTYATPATGHEATGFDYTSITNSPLLRRGDNVIAVEVHQSDVASSDIVFGLAARALAATPITITQQPANQTAAAGDRVTMSVGATGSAPVFQWYFNGAAIANARSSNYVINSVQLAQAGTYYVIVSNAVSSVRSSNAVLTVLQDIFPPDLDRAFMTEGSSNIILLNFSEALIRFLPGPTTGCPSGCPGTPSLCPQPPTATCDPFRYAKYSATNNGNYAVQCITGTNITDIPIDAVALQGGTIRLTLATNIFYGTNDYFVTVRNVMDSKTNILPFAQAGIQFVINTNLVAFQSVWSANTCFADSITNTWMKTNYVEGPADGWGAGMAPFYYYDVPTNTCFGTIGRGQGLGTEVSIGWPTYLFRQKFVVPTNSPTEGILRFAHTIDDGAVFYLNGTEVFRYNMPVGPVSCDSPPASSVDANCRTNTLGFANLLPGTNLLAVEVHDMTTVTPLDMMFGCQVDAVYTNGPSIPAPLQYKKITNAPQRMVVMGVPKGYRLMTSTTPRDTNSWTAVTLSSTNATTYTNNISAAEKVRAYKLRRP